MTRSRQWPSGLTILVAAAALASTASAETSPLFTRGSVDAARPGLKLSRPTPALAYASRDTRTGFPQTAVSHRLSRDGPVASLGYLCGIKPFAPDYYQVGAGPTSGFNRGLTFLGVKLDYAFR